MFTDTINKCAANAARIARLSANNPLGFWVSSAMAGAYVGGEIKERNIYS